MNAIQQLTADLRTEGRLAALGEHSRNALARELNRISCASGHPVQQQVLLELHAVEAESHRLQARRRPIPPC